MKAYIDLVGLLFFWFAASAQLKEQFSDSNLTHIWHTNDSDWIINSNHQLQSHNTTANSRFYISTENKLAVNTEWQFWIRLHFNTSSANYVEAYLTATNSNLSDNSNTGYIVRIGSTDDDICLYRKDSTGNMVKLIDGRNGITNHSDNTLKIKVVRNNNLFTLYTDTSGTGNNYVAEGSVADNTYITSSYFGFLVRQSTASFFQKHYMDDIVIQPYIPDTTPPLVQSVQVIADNQLAVLFSEPVDRYSSETLLNYAVDNNMGVPVSVQCDATNAALIYLTLAGNFSSGHYTISIRNIKDLSGNIMADTTIAFSYYATRPSDIVINEILFNPKPNSSDYIELYNSSDETIDISRLYIANRNSSGSISSIKKISDTAYHMPPESYAVITEDIYALRRDYLVKDIHAIITIPSLPSFPDKEGTVVIINAQKAVIDEVHYNENWHFALLNNVEGISLERIDPKKESQDKTNWHSAAASAGYGTPGYQNSQYNATIDDDITLTITPKLFSPDNDGYNDITTIHYQMTEPGYMATITIFDAAGRPVRYLVKNNMLGISGSYIWDGLNEKGQKLPSGTYILYTELFNLQGQKKQFKNAVILARRLN